jgi:exopolyphosphatase/guanosine-5'-triphosphate,3'-diphosphate pyrophosphatase
MSLSAEDPARAARAEFVALMHQREARPAHVQHVARLALALFDSLVSLHGLASRERLLLEAASHLHDIGHGSPTPNDTEHHKESARLIRAHAWVAFNAREVELMAQVARYHRRALPDFTHDEFCSLPAEDRDVVMRLAALLRLADALDRTHAQLVRRLAAELTENRIVIHVQAEGAIERELTAARQRGDLATLVFQRELEFVVEGGSEQPGAGG